jgi:hypothetical protein
MQLLLAKVLGYGGGWRVQATGGVRVYEILIPDEVYLSIFKNGLIVCLTPED